MNDSELVASWEREECQPFVGWDFSYLNQRKQEEQWPQRYIPRAIELMRSAQSALDLDTGGGERLLEMRSYWPTTLYATEGYPPNLRVSTERLTPLGVKVFDVESNEKVQLPFADSSFDLVLNRHGGTMNIDEIARVLRPGGTFLTQQVHGKTLLDLLAVFNATPQWPDATPGRYVPWIKRVGLELINLEEYSGAEIFLDVGAIVYFLHATPWLVPGFSVATHLSQLRELQGLLNRGETLRFTTRGYLIEALKSPQLAG
jgi:SAM-dependent methyltransferase